MLSDPKKDEGKEEGGLCMFNEFVESQHAALKAEADRLWALIPVEFSNDARVMTFGRRHYKRDDYFCNWLLALIADGRYWTGYSDLKDCRDVLKKNGWLSLQDAEYAFDCLAFAWKDEINVEVKMIVKSEGAHRGTYLEVTFSISDRDT